MVKVRVVLLGPSECRDDSVGRYHRSGVVGSYSLSLCHSAITVK
jgi:hypothetical protein